jgi:hypothetical protein
VVFKRYIERDGKKFGPYYYESYRDEKGNTHTKYLPNYKPERAVTKPFWKRFPKPTSSHEPFGKNNLFRKHSTLFIFLGAIILIFLAISFLNYQFSETQNKAKTNFFESVGKNVYSFFTGFTTEGSTPDSTSSTPDSNGGSSDNSAPSDITSIPNPENPLIETATPPEQSTTENPEEITPPSTDFNENITENIPEENITQAPQTNESETTPSETESGGAGVSISNQTNQTEINETSNVILETSVKQYGAVIGKPVRWEKRIKVISESGAVENLRVDLPDFAGNVSVTKITENGKEEVDSIVQNEKKIEEVSPTGKNIEDSRGSFLTRTFNFILGFLRFTGNVVDEGQGENVSVEITGSIQDQDEIVVEYYTDAPYAEETYTDKKQKQVSIIGPEGINYENVLAFTDLVDETNASKIKVYHVVGNSREKIISQTSDSNGNGLIDKVEWIVSELNNRAEYVIVIGGREVRVIVKLKSYLSKDLSEFGETQKSLEIENNNIEVVNVDEDFIDSLKNDPNVESVVEDQPVSLLLNDSEQIVGSLEVRNEFGLNGNGKKICVIDSGVDYNNPAITNYFWGWDFVNNDSDVMDDNGHGTSVAGVVSRIAPGSQLYIAKVIDSNGTGYESTILEALQWCMNNNVSVISFSIGSGSYAGFCDSNIVADLANTAVSQGIFVVAATGNDGNSSLKSPSCASNVTRVASTNKQDEISNFSNGGEMIDVLSPGENILVPVLGNGFDLRSGTSLSAPMVASAAAIVLENETLSPYDLKYRLRSTGKPIEYSIDLLTQINISRLDVYNAVIKNKTMDPWNYSGNQIEINYSNITIEPLVGEGCTAASCADGTACCNSSASVCVKTSGTGYTCKDSDTSAASCSFDCDVLGEFTGATACVNGQFIAKTWSSIGCCGDDKSTTDNINGNTTLGCCCYNYNLDSLSAMMGGGVDEICTSNSNYWCLDGTYCTTGSGLASDPSLTATGSTYTFDGDDIICGCQSGTGIKCDTNDAGKVANGLCVADSTCDTDTVRYEASEYWQTCGTSGATCDSDVTPTSTTPQYATDGACASSACDIDEVCNNEGVYTSDCSSCSIASSDIDACDTDTNASGYVANGYCVTGGTCTTGNVYAPGSVLTAGCGTGAEACDIAADGTESGDFATAANGVCASSACDQDEVGLNAGVYYSSCDTAGSGVSVSCDADVTTNYVADGLCTENNNAGTTGEICCNTVNEDSVGTTTSDTDPTDYCPIEDSSSPSTGSTCDSDVSDGVGNDDKGIWTGTSAATCAGATCDCCTNSYMLGSVATDISPYDSCTATCDTDGKTCVTNANFVDWDGIASGELGVCTDTSTCTAGMVSKSGADYATTCDSTGKECDQDVSEAAGYVADAICASNACDPDHVAKSGASYYACSATYNGIQCDSATPGAWSQNGQCSSTTCCQTELSANYACGCTDAETQSETKCDNTITSGDYSADGICAISGTPQCIVNANDICVDSANGNRFTSGAANCENSDQCDSSLSGADYVADGLVCNTYSLGCVVNGTRTAGQSCCATANCAAGGLTCNSGTCTVPGNPPIITQLAIAPSSPTHTNNLDCNVTATDIDNSTFTIEWYWYKGITLITSGNTTGVNNNTNTVISTLLEGNTSKGEVWNCTVRGYDNATYGNYNSTNVTIPSNQIPDTPSPTLLSYDGSNNTQSNLTCIVLITDPDGENMNVSVNWYKNNVFNTTYNFDNHYVNGSVFNATLTTGNLTAGDSWNCSVRTYDSWNYSSWGNSNAVTIIYPSVDLSLIYPTSNINVAQNSFFNVTLNVTCRNDNCGTINASLYVNNSLTNTTVGATPFYTNASTNPLTTSSLNKDQSQTINFWVNATGANANYTFFSTANFTSNLSVSNQTSNWNVTIVIYGPPQWSQNSTNSTDRGTSVEHRVKWTDETALSGYIFSFDNGTGTFVNDSFVSMIGATNWSNVTKVVNSTYNVTIRWKVYSNDSENTWNSTDTFSYLTTNIVPTTPTPDLTSVDGTNSTPSNLNCSDAILDSNRDALNVSVKWYKNAALNLTVDYNNSYANGTLFNATLASGNLTSGDVWMCSLRLYDGVNYSSWGNSSNLSIIYPTVDLSLIYPTGNINVTQNRFFNVSLNVTCRNGNCGAINVSLDPSNWANTSCNSRRPLTFTKPFGTENLTNFPVLVVLNSSRINYARTGATDIRFYDADNTTLLNKETELWNSSGNSFLWVKVPQLNNDTVSDYVWTYYNCSTTNVDNKTGVWDSSYTAVYHSNSATAGVLVDSTNQYNGTQGNSPSAATGKIDGAMNYAVASQQYYSTTITSGKTFTWEVWANVSSYTTYHTMIGIATSYMLFDQLSGALSVWTTDGLGGDVGGITGLSTNTMYHLVFVREGDSKTAGYKYYKNGIYSGYPNNTGTWAASTALWIADRSDTLAQAFNGVLDEVRISSTNRSVSWINASYLTEMDTFLTYGSEENQSTAKGLVSTIVGTTPFYTNASYNPNTTASLNKDQSQTINFWVNATGDISTTHNFFAYANLTSNLSISNQTSNWNVTIQGNNAPITPTPLLESVDGSNNTQSNLNCSDVLNDLEGDTMNVSVKWYKNAALNLTINYNNSYSNNTLFNATLASGNLTSGDTWMCSLRFYDGSGYSSWGNSSNLSIIYPTVDISLIYPTGNINATQYQFFNVTLNVTCRNGNCGTINVSLDPYSSIFSDNFDDNSLDSSKWVEFDHDGFGSVAEQGQQLNVSIVGNADWSGSAVDTVTNFSTTGAYMISYNVYQVDNEPGTGDAFKGLWIENASHIASRSSWSEPNYGTLHCGVFYHVGYDGSVDECANDGCVSIHSQSTGCTTWLGSWTNDVYKNDSQIFALNTWTLVNITVNWTSNYTEIYIDNKLTANGTINSTDVAALGNQFKIEWYMGEYQTSGYVSYLIDNVTVYNLTDGQTKLGLVSTVAGTTPFYTNASYNPNTTASLNKDQSQTINFWVNATGTTDTTHTFFAYANLTSNLSINNQTSNWNVTIVNQSFSVAIDLSSKLASQINWTLSTIPAYNQSAEGNNGTLVTEYWVNISASAGTADLYLKASGNLTTSGGSILGLGNETYSYNSSNSSVPSDAKYQLTTNFADNKIADAVTSGLVYLKFFLTVPSGQPAGTYNNTVDFKAVQTGQSP